MRRRVHPVPYSLSTQDSPYIFAILLFAGRVPNSLCGRISLPDVIIKKYEVGYPVGKGCLVVILGKRDSGLAIEDQIRLYMLTWR